MSRGVNAHKRWVKIQIPILTFRTVNGTVLMFCVFLRACVLIQASWITCTCPMAHYRCPFVIFWADLRFHFDGFWFLTILSCGCCRIVQNWPRSYLKDICTILKGVEITWCRFGSLRICEIFLHFCSTIIQLTSISYYSCSNVHNPSSFGIGVIPSIDNCISQLIYCVKNGCFIFERSWDILPPGAHNLNLRLDFVPELII